MKPDQIERVFGRGRLKMATGEHVEVFREAVGANERRRYTKRFLETGDADFRQWTAREWRILARLIGHGIRCVPDVVQFDGGPDGGMRQVQTYDAGVTVDQWATLLPVARDGVVRRNVFEDCAHWWALAHHCLAALQEIHALQLVHLDIKADNICIPYAPAGFDAARDGASLHVDFARLALIDFAFSLVSRERLASALPIGWQKDYDYQSPRLLRALEAGRAGNLQPTQDLDWRCDLYSLAAMLRRYLPDDEWFRACGVDAGWNADRYDDARALVYRLRESHDGDAASTGPHASLMALTRAYLEAPDLVRSLARGWMLAHDVVTIAAPVLVTPLTRIALAPVARTLPTRITLPARAMPPVVMTAITPAVVRYPRLRVPVVAPGKLEPVAVAPPRPRRRAGVAVGAVCVAMAALAVPSFVGDGVDPVAHVARGGQAQPRVMPEPQTVADATPAAPAVVAPVAVPAATAPSASAPARPTAAAPAATAAAPRPALAGASPPAVEPPSEAGPMHRRAVPSARDKVARAPSAPAGVSPARPARERAPIVAHAHVPPVRWAAARAKSPAGSSGPAVTDTVVATESPPAAPSVATSTAPSPAMASAATRNDAIVITEVPRLEPEARPSSSSPSLARSEVPSPGRAQQRDPLRMALHDVLKLFGAIEQRAAPVEDRSADAPRLLATAPKAPLKRPTPAAMETVRVQPGAVLDTGVRPVPSMPPMPSMPPEARPALAEPPQDDLGAAGRRMLADAVPRVAAQANLDVARVLWAAAMAQTPAQERTVLDASYVPWRAERAYPAPNNGAEQSRALQSQARGALASGRDAEALELAVRALAADPRDPDTAGFLAFLHLRLRPAQAETARQLALYALAFSGSRRSLRVSDWNTLAIASALTGREVDASRAFLVELALSSDVDRSCRDAMDAYVMYGERLRMPVDGLMRRVHAQARSRLPPACTWPGEGMVASSMKIP